MKTKHERSDNPQKVRNNMVIYRVDDVPGSCGLYHPRNHLDTSSKLTGEQNSSTFYQTQ